MILAELDTALLRLILSRLEKANTLNRTIGKVLSDHFLAVEETEP